MAEGVKEMAHKNEVLCKRAVIQLIINVTIVLKAAMERLTDEKIKSP